MGTPVPPEELPILEALINIRNRLTVLKKDRVEFIKSTDVNSLYQSVVKQVTKLNDLRDDATVYNNRVDTTLADVFNLLSLFYLTIGKTKDAPATYAQVASMKQILNHMNESGVYNESDLLPFRKRMSDIRNILHRKNPDATTKLLERQLNECESIVKTLEESLSVLSPELIPIHERLVTLRRQLVSLASKESASNDAPRTNKTELKLKSELKPIQDELRRIDSKRVDGKFLGPNGIVPSSQAICSSLLEECFDIIQEIKASDSSKHLFESTSDPSSETAADNTNPLKPIYDRLNSLRAELEHLALTRRWSLRETDLWNYSLSLQEIDKMRNKDGKFVDKEGGKTEGQYVLLYLLRRCYGLIYRLLSASEPVSEELMPIANKLSTVKKCLNEVLKYGGPWNPRDLYPYQLALHQIESRRQDGKFIGIDGNIPEGQGIVMAHLNECHELIELLKETMEEEEEEEDEDGYEDDLPGSDEEEQLEDDDDDDSETAYAGEVTR